MKHILKLIILCFNIAFSTSSSAFKKTPVDIDSWTASTPIGLPARTFRQCSIACLTDPSCQAFNFYQDVCTTSSATTFFSYLKQKAVLDVWVNPTSTTITKKISTTLNYDELLGNDDYIYSPNACYQVKLQSDGNLVIYRMANNGAVWATNSNFGPGPQYRLSLRPSSELILYRDNSIIWRSNKAGTSCYAFAQDDSNFKVVCGTPVSILWAAHGTSRGC